MPWPSIPALAYGADYNPEQWPRSVWDDDVRLMRQAGVNVVSLGIFSWALIEIDEDKWDFTWLDDIINLLHKNGISIDLATATASPPPWLTTKHPEILPVTDDGTIISPGGRQQYRPTSPVFKEYAVKLVRKMAERYGSHPGVVAWHVSNEFGCHNHSDYSIDAERAFKVWLERKYGTVDKLNNAWNTAFWSQHYTSFDQILPPRKAFTYANPTQQLDWRRFSSDALLDCFKYERDALHAITPHIPVTHNFMVMGGGQKSDYAAWADELDFVANDHYVTEGGRDELSISANLTSGISHGKPWWLMESSTSGVNWQAVNTPKRAGEMAWHSLTHVAHGADAVCFFQWRQSKAGAETWHSSMVPHAGEHSRLFKDVVKLGTSLQALKDVLGSRRVKAQVALLVDYNSWWACEQDSHPSSYLKYYPELLAWYSALLEAGIRVDVLPATSTQSESDWSNLGYALVFAPILHVVDPDLAKRVHEYVHSGGHFVTTYFSGVVDSNTHVHLGGYPGAFRELLGIRVEEYGPIPDGARVKLDNGEGDLWSEPIDLISKNTEVLRRYVSGKDSFCLYPGQPAVTLHTPSQGNADTDNKDKDKDKSGWAAYVSTRLTSGRADLAVVFARRAGVKPELSKNLIGKVELTIREKDGDRWAFIVALEALEAPVDMAELTDTFKGRVVLNERSAVVEGEFGNEGGGGAGGGEMLFPRGVVVIKLE